MAITYNQRDVTRNQSTVDYTQEIVFLECNESREAVFLNNTGGDLDLEQGILVRRDISTPGQVIPAIAGATLADIIGIVRIECPVTLADTETLDINYAFNGTVDSGLLVLPGGVTLDTTVGNKHLVDVLTGLGFNPKEVTDNSNFDN